jgi:hypothetical protein
MADGVTDSTAAAAANAKASKERFMAELRWMVLGKTAQSSHPADSRSAL